MPVVVSEHAVSVRVNGDSCALLAALCDTAVPADLREVCLKVVDSGRAQLRRTRQAVCDEIARQDDALSIVCARAIAGNTAPAAKLRQIAYDPHKCARDVGYLLVARAPTRRDENLPQLVCAVLDLAFRHAQTLESLTIDVADAQLPLLHELGLCVPRAAFAPVHLRVAGARASRLVADLCTHAARLPLNTAVCERAGVDPVHTCVPGGVCTCMCVQAHEGLTRLLELLAREGPLRAAGGTTGFWWRAECAATIVLQRDECVRIAHAYDPAAWAHALSSIVCFDLEALHFADDSIRAFLLALWNTRKV